MIRFIVVLLLLPFHFSCTINTVDNESTESSAVIYMTDGHTPAQGAHVFVYDAGNINNQPEYIAITNEHGRFFLGSLAYGYYSIMVCKDSLVLFQDSIKIASQCTTIRDDTLESPSILTGFVSVELPHDPGTVTIGLAGTDKQCTIGDTGGLFTFNQIAAGTYTLVINSSHPEYIPVYKTISVASHSQNKLPDTIECTYKGIPYVKGITIIEDTLNETAMIRWNNTSLSTIQDYLIYRDPGTAIYLSSKPIFSTTDTFFTDSGFNDILYDSDVSNSMSYKYRVAVRTINQEIGPTAGYTEFHFAPKSAVSTTCTHEILCRSKVCDTVSIADTVTFLVHLKNQTRSLEKIVWYDSSGHDTITTSTFKNIAIYEVYDSLNYSYSDTGRHSLYAIITDNSGTNVFHEMVLYTVIDSLKAFAGNDTGVFTGESIHLHGDAKDKFGSIAIWKWKIGPGTWTKTSGPDTVIIAPSTEELLVCSLMVTDEDGTSRCDDIMIMSSSRVINCVTGQYHSLILKADGGLWSCGNNSNGQLGDGTLRSRTLPVRIMSDVLSMAAGRSHSLLLKTDGSLWVCGDNNNSQFGNGTLEGHLTPSKIMTDVKDIAANSNYSLILKTDGTLLACGWNGPDLQNDSSEYTNYLPVKIMNDVRCMSAGVEHIMILKTDGTLWSCGKNHYGQLGDGTQVDNYIPKQIMTNVINVVVNGAHSMILKDDGTLWECGLNYSAQLGYYGYSGSTRSRSTPVQIMSDVRNMSAGWYHSLIVKTDSTLWASGFNPSYVYTGQFGSYDNRFTSIQVMTGVQKVAAGLNSSLIIKTDGSLWGCGDNDFGNLGNGVKSFHSDPIRIIPYEYHDITIRQMQNE